MFSFTPGRRLRFLGLLLALSLASAVSLSAMARRPNGPVPFPVEAEHPYAGAFNAYNRLSPEDREAVHSTVAAEALSPAARKAREAIASSLATGREAPPVWQAEHDPLLPGYDPEFLGTLGSLAAAQLSAAGKKGDAAGDAATLDALALFQSVGPGLPAGEWARQQDMIIDALGLLQKRGTPRSPAEAAALAAALRALPPLTSFEEMVRAEPFWKEPGEKLRRALEREARLLGLKSERIGAGSLRLTGFVIEPERVAIALETPSGSFWLEPGKTEDGVTLLEFDAKSRRARILFQEREATIELRSRRIERWDDAILDQAVESLGKKSDFMVGALLTRQGGSLSEHLERVDAFAREATQFWREAAEDPARLSESKELSERLEQLKALAPWPNFDGADFLKEIRNGRAKGLEAEAARQATLDLLDSQAASASPAPAPASATKPARP